VDRLDKIERMLQLVLDALCELAKETTGRTMLLGDFNGEIGIGAAPESPHIKWGE